MMRYLSGVIVALALMVALAIAQEKPEPLLPCEAAEADSLQLKAEVARLTMQLANVTLENERIRLETKFRARLNPPPDAVFDWQTRTFKTPEKPTGQ